MAHPKGPKEKTKTLIAEAERLLADGRLRQGQIADMLGVSEGYLSTILKRYAPHLLKYHPWRKPRKQVLTAPQDRFGNTLPDDRNAPCAKLDPDPPIPIRRPEIVRPKYEASGFIQPLAKERLMAGR